MIRAQLTPAQWTAWQILQRLPDADLLNRPGAALAKAMGITGRVARIHLHNLREAGLVSRVGTQGICVVQPRAGSVFYAAATTITAENPYARTIPGVRQGGGSPLSPRKGDPPFAVSWQDPREIRCSVPAVVFSVSDLELEQPPQKARTPASEIARRLKKVKATVGQSPRARKARPEDTAEGHFFVQLYVERRQKVDPEFAMPTARDVAKLGEAVRQLEKRKVGRRLWGRYLDHVFEAFTQVTRGRCLYPPTGQVGSTTWIDSYVATLGKRPRDVEQVHRMLAGAGFKTDRADSYIAVQLADRLAQKKSMPPDLHEDKHLHAMVQWLAERIDEIGYYDDLDGDVDAGKH